MYKSLIASQQQISSFFLKAYSSRPSRIYSYYTSTFDKIITQQHNMLMPIDDRMAIRGHAVFDVIYFKKGKLINMRQHIDRLITSAKSIDIETPFTVEQMEKKIVETVGATLEMLVEEGMQIDHVKGKVFIVRLHISSGYGDFGISSLGKKPIFSIIVSEPYINYEIEKNGVRQYIVLESSPKPAHLTSTKSVNYVENTLMANLSKEKGGYMGIKVTNKRVILEAAVANVAFMFAGVFTTPRFETVVRGTTIMKCLKKLEELKKQGVISGIVERDVTETQAYEADEMMVIGGDKIVPVLYLDDRLISQEKGKITQILQNWYEDEIEQGVSVPFCDKI